MNEVRNQFSILMPPSYLSTYCFCWGSKFSSSTWVKRITAACNSSSIKLVILFGPLRWSAHACAYIHTDTYPHMYICINENKIFTKQQSWKINNRNEKFIKETEILKSVQKCWKLKFQLIKWQLSPRPSWRKKYQEWNTRLSNYYIQTSISTNNTEKKRPT